MSAVNVADSALDASGVLAEASVFSWAPCPAGYELAKRILDVTFAVLTLVLLSPLWIAIAIAILATSPGPVFYRGRVAGEGGRIFTWYKFRTMRPADDTAHREFLQGYVLADQPYRPGVYKLSPDPRVTRIGAILRRFSLDEVPQLINVLRGEMSVVGPRPPIEYEFNLYDDQRRRRLAVKPGITGLFQVTGRSTAPFSVMLSTDLEYINRRSLSLDLSIMARTLAVMINGRGAA